VEFRHFRAQLADIDQAIPSNVAATASCSRAALSWAAFIDGSGSLPQRRGSVDE
jgi:hypothetical protein